MTKTNFMTQTIEVRCPNCNSNQLTANKKGFSGKKALVGGLIAGGAGILAGTIGSNMVKITCLACGKKFKPGEGHTVIIDHKNSNKAIKPCIPSSQTGEQN